MQTSHPKIRGLLRSLYLLEFERARQLVDEIVGFDPALGCAADGILSYYLADPEEALRAFEEATAEGVEDPALAHTHALALVDLGRPWDAVLVLEGGAARHPDDATLKAALSDLYTRVGEPRKALERLHGATGKRGVGPTVEARRTRAEALAQLGNPDEALVELQTAIREFPFDQRLMERALALFVETSREEEGVAFFQSLQRKRQIDRLASLLCLADLLLRLGRARKVDEVCARLEAMVPNDRFALGALARLYERQGKPRKIKTLAKKMGPEVLPEIRAEVLLVLARVLHAEGYTARARAAVAEGLESAPYFQELEALRATWEAES